MKPTKLVNRSPKNLSDPTKASQLVSGEVVVWTQLSESMSFDPYTLPSVLDWQRAPEQGHSCLVTSGVRM